MGKYALYETDGNVLILPGAKVCGDVRFAPGCSVWYNAVIRADGAPVIIGEKTNIQDGALIHGDDGTMTIGSEVTIGHGAILHGRCVGDRSLIGMGAILLQGSEIGADCIVAAGAVVTGRMRAPDRSMLMGSPAKVVRTLTDEDLAGNRAAAEEYLAAAEEYRNG